MNIEVDFQLKNNILNWSNQKWKSKMSDGSHIIIDIDKVNCKLEISHDLIEKAKELLYTIWELLAWYDGYFYKPIKYIINGKEQNVDDLYTLNMYSSDSKWVTSSILIGRNKRCFSEEIITKYLEIREADRKSKSMNKTMINSFFYLKSAAYKEINIEHRLVLLMHICDGFAIQFLNGSKKNNSGNINIVVTQLNTKKYKHGADLLGISSNKAMNALGDTRNELTHYIYKENSLGAYISNPDYETDNMANLYVFYVLEAALRISLLQTIGFQVADGVKEYILDENLDWIRLERQLDEECTIPNNILIQMIKKLQN